MNATGVKDRTLLTIQVEDYFQVGSFEKIIDRERWYRFETRLERNTREALELLASFEIRATFFVLGWVAEKLPQLIREIAAAGHEVASQGYHHRAIGTMSPEQFREDLSRSREAIQRATGTRILGHRVPHFLGPADLWALDVLAEEGYAYDSSLRPLFRQFAGEPDRRVAHTHVHAGRSLWEFPIPSWQVLGHSIPIGGGNYYRQLPHTLLKPIVRQWHDTHKAPFVMYFHVWELDPSQPKINSGSFLTRVRHYRNLDKMEWVLPRFFREYLNGSVAEYLGLDQTQPAPQPPPSRPAPALVTATDAAPNAQRVSIVVPCYKETQALPYLANTLRALEGHLAPEYRPQFVFVDDGSPDDTWETLNGIFGGWPQCTLLRHETNEGVAAAILTGIRGSATEVVCSMDCDCTYDPNELKRMIPLLSPEVSVVTASPYHPEGRVKNVPSWRLGLSRGASFLYRRVFRQQLHTYTSCFRVYRRAALQDLEIDEGGFLGVAEMLGRLDLKGARIAEHPAVLEVRIFGQSKMKAARAILGHLKLMARLLWLRFRSSVPPEPLAEALLSLNQRNGE